MVFLSVNCNTKRDMCVCIVLTGVTKFISKTLLYSASLV